MHDPGIILEDHLMNTKINGQIIKFPVVSKISFEPLPFPEKEIERDINEILQFYKNLNDEENGFLFFY